MPGEFYIEGKAEKLDLTDIKEIGRASCRERVYRLV
jgi:hypothetical protein